MNLNVLFFINTRFWKDYDKLNDVKQPFLDIYNRFSKCYESSNSIADLFIKIKHNSNNNVLFYTSLENHISKRCDHYISKVEKYVENKLNYLLKKNDYSIKFYPTKVKTKDVNAGKGKRILSLLFHFKVGLQGPNPLDLLILFPIEYNNFH